jgi:hypothetical protein
MEAISHHIDLVTCRCRHCEENIQFDSSEFAEEFSMIPCPHCGLDTRLYLPPEVLPPELATKAQVNYIRQLGLTPPPQMPFETARLMIQEAMGTAKATAKQKELMRALGAGVGVEFTMAEADQIIARMLEKQGRLADEQTALLPRQMQILRFWDRIDLVLSSKKDVAQWLNEFYDADAKRRVAWEKFQAEYSHLWVDDPFWVPIGMSESYQK